MAFPFRFPILALCFGNAASLSFLSGRNAMCFHPHTSHKKFKNARAMSSAFMVDNYLDLYDAYDEDAGAGILTRFAPERARR